MITAAQATSVGESADDPDESSQDDDQGHPQDVVQSHLDGRSTAVSTDITADRGRGWGEHSRNRKIH